MNLPYIKNYRSNAGSFIYVYKSDNHTFNFKNLYVSNGQMGGNSGATTGGGFFRVYRNISLGGERASKNIKLNVENCTFTNNTTRQVDAGSLFKVQTDEATNGSKASFKNNKFCGNSHIGTGVGTCIHIEGAEEITFENNTFTNNAGRALVHLAKCYAKSIKNNIFYNNTSDGRDGVAYSFEGEHNLVGTGYIKDYVIDGDKFYGNHFIDGGTATTPHGGAISVKEASLEVKNCIFIENKALRTLISEGGAIYVKDGKFTSNNCVYKNNEASHSGGAIKHDGNFNFSSTNDKFYGNKASFNNNSSIYRGGGAVCFERNLAHIAFNGCNFLNNQSNHHGGAIKVNGTSNTASDLNVLNNCRFWGNEAATGSNKDVYTTNSAKVGTTTTPITNCYMQHTQATYPTSVAIPNRFIFGGGNNFAVNPIIPVPPETIPDASNFDCPEVQTTFNPHIEATIGTDITTKPLITEGNICINEVATTKVSAFSNTGMAPFTIEYRIDKLKPGMTAWQIGTVQTKTTVPGSIAIHVDVPNENELEGITYRFVGLKITDARGRVKDYNPCGGTHFISVSVNPKPKISPSYSYSCPGPDVILNTNFTLTETATQEMENIGAQWNNSTNATSWEWTGPSGFTSTEQNPTVTNITSAGCGEYTVTVTDNNGCTNSASVTVILNTADTDGDGVLDVCDLDCDNDGILDADELYCDNPDLPIATTTGKGKFKTQLGFFDFTGAEWNAIGDKVTRTATYNGVTYIAEVTYINIYNKVIPSGNDTTDLRNLPDNPAVPKFEGWDMNTWDVTNQPQMIKHYYNVNGINFKEAIYYNKNAVGAKPLHGEASFKIDVKAHIEGQPDNPVPFQLVIFDAEGSGMEALNNWTGQVKYTDLQGRGFQSLEKTGTANYNDVVTVTHHTFTRTAKKVELSNDNLILYYNHTANLPGLPSNVSGLFETIEYTSASHSVRVDVKARSGCQAFGFAVRTLCDTDSDGIPNFLDLDSDGDGCYDAIEGDENVTAAHLNANGSINTAANGGVNSDGVPNLVNSGGAADIGGDVGQGAGYSKNPLVNACTDTDGDGVPNIYDLDCDNDGILDIDELYCNNPDLPVTATAGRGQYKTQLGFFDFTGAEWNAIGDKVTRTATYNGVTYTAEVTYIDIYNKSIPGGDTTTDLRDLPDNPAVPKFEGWDMNTWDVTTQPQMIKNYYNVNGTNFKEAIYYNKNAVGAKPLHGEASFKIDVKAHIEGQPGNLVPFQLVVFDAEGSGMEALNNWTGQITYTDLQGKGFQSLEKTGTANYDDVVTVTHHTFTRTAKKVELSPDNRILYYNHTANLTGLPSNVNGLFETIDYTSSNHVVRVDLKARSGCQAFGFAVRTLCDIDADGVPNFLDLDSDGDGCYDAIEGDENVTSAHLNANGSINITANGGVNADGVPNLVNPGGAADVGGDVGQGIGYSQFNNINVCADADGDGVPDIDDIDKDNDGILDMDELYCDNPDLPSETTTGSGTFKTQLGFFDFTGAEWNAIGDKVTRTATYNGVTYTADVTYTYVQNYNRPSAVNIELTSGTPNPTKVSKFEGKDINTWAGGPEQMIYKNYNVTNKHEVIWVKGSGTLIGEARFKVEVRAEKGTVPVPFQLVVFDAEATSLTLDNNWPEQIRFMDYGYGFQSLEKTGTGNYNDVVTISHNGFYRALQKIELSADNRTLSYNYTDNNNHGVMTGNPSNVNGLFETIDYTLSKHTVDVVVKTNGGAQAFGFAVRTLCDIDADGIPNFLDLDSDGDGCFDAMEGEDYVTEEQLNADGSINIAATGGVDADGVPNLVNPGGAGDVDKAQGQRVGESQNSAIDLCNNFWVGGTTGFVNAWDSVANWSQGIVPYPLHDVEFANNQPGSDGKVALADLHVPVGNPKTIGRLINSTNKATIVPATASLTINEQVSGSETLDKAHKLMVKAEAGQANGTLIVTKGCTQPPIFGTVQFYAKGIKGSEETWTDNIVGSPTEGQFFTTSYQWQYFGVPVKSIVANPTFLGASLRMYDEAYNGDNTKFYQKWHWLNNNSVLEAFKGYSITQEEATTYTIAGELNFCDKTVTMTRQAPIVTGATGYVQNTRYGLGQNLFGNSYTAAIDISKLVLPDDIVEKTIYLYNTGRFHDWASTGTLTTGTSPQLSAGNWFAIPQESAKAVWNNEIPSMQGFMLKFTDTVLEAGPGTPVTINIPYAAAGEPKVIPNTKPQLAPGQHGQRASRAIEQEQSSPLSYLRINLESASTRDALWLISREGTTDHFDDGWDGRKHFGTPTAFIFTENKDGLMQVNADKTIDGSMISFYANADTEYELTLIKSNLEQYTNLHLHDLVTETSLALDADTTYYRFTATNEGNVEKRFVILNNHKLKLKNDGSINPLNAYLKHDNLLIVNNLSDNEGQITLYSITGSNVFSQHIPIGITEIPLNLPKGIYLVNLRAESNHETVKIAVR